MGGGGASAGQGSQDPEQEHSLAWHISPERGGGRLRGSQGQTWRPTPGPKFQWLPKGWSLVPLWALDGI